MKPSFDVLTKSYSQLRSAQGMLSLVAGLREFFREPVTLEKANEEMKSAGDAGAKISGSRADPGIRP